MLAVFGIGFFEMLILGGIGLALLLGVVIAIVVVVAAAGQSRRQ